MHSKHLKAIAFFVHFFQKKFLDFFSKESYSQIFSLFSLNYKYLDFYTLQNMENKLISKKNISYLIKVIYIER